jgi:O-antigen ligase
MHLGNPRRVGIKSLCGIVTGNTLLAIAILCFAGITADNRLGNSDFLHPNVIGKQMALAGLCSFYLLTNTERSRLGTFLWLTTYILLCSTLLLSLSKTSIIAFFTAQIFMLLMSKPSKLIVSIYSLAIISISFVVFSRLSNYTEDYLYTTQQGKALETVSGRVLVWAGTTEMILSNPWFGHGIMAFRDVGPQVASERLITAHNELLHQWFSYGIIGPIFILLIYSVFFIQLYQIRKHNKYHTEVALSMSLFLFYIIRGFFEAESIGLVFPLPVLLLLIFWLGNLNKIGPEQDLHANDK